LREGVPRQRYIRTEAAPAADRPGPRRAPNGQAKHCPNPRV